MLQTTWYNCLRSSRLNAKIISDTVLILERISASADWDKKTIENFEKESQESGKVGWLLESILDIPGTSVAQCLARSDIVKYEIFIVHLGWTLFLLKLISRTFSIPLYMYMFIFNIL